MQKDRYGNITKKGLEECINKNAEEGKTQVMDNGEKIVVKFVDSSRYYEINADGDISDPIEIDEIEYAGDLTKGGKYDGSEENPFQIDCIEDLVTFSIMTNGGDSELGISSNNFLNKYVILNRTLDFKSVFSYSDYTTKFYGDLNGDTVIEDIRTELTKTAEGCKGFTAIKEFMGTFDGKENMIKNIYQKVDSGNIALFVIPSKEIKNVSISGTIINSTWEAAGIAHGGAAIISNCKNYANITGYNMVGGIVNQLTGGKISNCINYGTITITGKSYQYGAAGGIVGVAQYGQTIENCVNEGEVNGEVTRAGIVGGSHTEGANIRNCVNKGKSSAGIVSWIDSGTTNIINCYNLAECDNGIVDRFAGASWSTILELNIKNCYNLGKVSNSGIIGSQENLCAKITLNIENCYNAGSSNNAILGKVTYNANTETLTNITNTYYETTKSTSVGAIAEGITGLTETEIKNSTDFMETLNNNIGTNTEWKNWKIGEDGYPTFE